MYRKRMSKRSWGSGPSLRAKRSSPTSETAAIPSSSRSDVTVEYDSCYRGKIEIWKDEKGEVVRMEILR